MGLNLKEAGEAVQVDPGPESNSEDIDIEEFFTPLVVLILASQLKNASTDVKFRINIAVQIEKVSFSTRWYQFLK